MNLRSLVGLIYNSPRMRLRTAVRKQTLLLNWLPSLLKDVLRKYTGSDVRLMRLLYGLEQTKSFTEPVAECGIGSGYSLTYILSYLQQTKALRVYHGFDTFEGFPYIHEEDLKDIPEHRKKISVVGHYRDYNIGHINRIVGRLGAEKITTLHQGRFDETIPFLPDHLKFSFVYMDCDLYQSYKSCLDSMYPRVVPGGIIVFDEYEHTVDWPGARKAIDEFFVDKPEKPEPLPFGSSWMVRMKNVF